MNCCMMTSCAIQPTFYVLIAQDMKFSDKNFCRKCEHFHNFLRWSTQPVFPRKINMTTNNEIINKIKKVSHVKFLTNGRNISLYRALRKSFTNNKSALFNTW